MMPLYRFENAQQRARTPVVFGYGLVRPTLSVSVGKAGMCVALLS